VARRSQLGSFAVSMALHAGLIGLAAGAVYRVAAPRAAIPVSLLPGGGGGAGVAVAVPAAAPAAAAVKIEKTEKVEKMEKKAPPHVAMAKPKAAPAPQRSAPAAAQPAAVEAVGLGVVGGAGTGSGVGSGSGSGGGSGSGEGGGVGAGHGKGQALDLRLYCLSCPEPLYPRVARARGWQGATDVELTVLADGRVDDVSVARSSGFDVLDSAALEVARQSRFSPPPQTVAPPVRGKLAYRFELRTH
jgi:protein TonB